MLNLLLIIAICGASYFVWWAYHDKSLYQNEEEYQDECDMDSSVP